MSTVTQSRVSARSAEKARRKAYVALYQSTGRDHADMHRRKRNGYVHELDFRAVRIYLGFATRSAKHLVDNLPCDRDNRRRWLGMLSSEKARVRCALAEIKEERLSGRGLWRPIGGDVPFLKGGSNV